MFYSLQGVVGEPGPKGERVGPMRRVWDAVSVVHECASAAGVLTSRFMGSS